MALYLDISRKGLEDFKEISDVSTHYNSINVSHNKLKDFKGCPPHIVYICAGYNPLESLDGLPKGLKYLNINYCSLSSLEGLPEGLEYLICENNNIKELCKENNGKFFQILPESLTFLQCGYNPLEKLKGLPESLKNLYCSNCEIKSLKPIRNLKLNFLSVGRNKISDLLWLPEDYDYNEDYYHIYNNPLDDRYKFKNSYKDERFIRDKDKIKVINYEIKVEKAIKRIVRVIKNKKATDIQRLWKKYWYEPYYDNKLGYYLSRFMLSKKDYLLDS